MVVSICQSVISGSVSKLKGKREEKRKVKGERDEYCGSRH